MSQALPSGAKRVQDFLSAERSASNVQVLSETTATAHDAAKALGVSVHQIGKSIVFGAGEVVILVVVCGDQRVRVDALSKVTGVQGLAALKAAAVKNRTGYAIGGVSPFALPSDVKVIIDSTLYGCEKFFVAAGHPKAVVLTRGEELLTLTGATVEAIAIGP
jgi:prolyl-tRNA editing enzyme YbaK/EbsC (Cys-tRNA(Pro) deacylase)